MEQTQSENISALANALVIVQSKVQGARKDATNPFYKSNYADLESVWESCRELLVKNGLCVIQTNGGTAEAPSVITTLAHTSGEWIRGELAMTPDKKGPQGTGSAITYARRYALAAIIGIYQVDDDAEGATHRGKKQEPKETPKAGRSVITEDQRIRLRAIASKNNWPDSAVKSLIATHGYESSKDIKWQDYEKIVKELEVEFDIPM